MAVVSLVSFIPFVPSSTCGAGLCGTAGIVEDETYVVGDILYTRLNGVVLTDVHNLHCRGNICPHIG